MAAKKPKAKKVPRGTSGGKRTGRPKGTDSYTQELADYFVEGVSSGIPLAQLVRERRDKGGPGLTTVYDWEKTHPEFAERVARARIAGYDQIAAGTLEIADDGRNDWMERLDKNGAPIGWMLNGEHVQRSKLRIDTRLKLLACWAPRQYGDKLELTGDPERPMQAKVDVAMSATEAFLKMKGGGG